MSPQPFGKEGKQQPDRRLQNVSTTEGAKTRRRADFSFSLTLGLRHLRLSDVFPEIDGRTKQRNIAASDGLRTERTMKTSTFGEEPIACALRRVEAGSPVADHLTPPASAYMVCQYMTTSPLERELKRGSAEMLILALLEQRPRHGYEISRLIEERSDGAITFHVTSLYPTLYRLEDKGLIEGRWVEKVGQRRRRCYRLTPAGRKVLASQRGIWQTFVSALTRVAGLSHA